jgi:hypothetical protein
MSFVASQRTDACSCDSHTHAGLQKASVGKDHVEGWLHLSVESLSLECWTLHALCELCRCGGDTADDWPFVGLHVWCSSVTSLYFVAYVLIIFYADIDTFR